MTKITKMPSCWLNNSGARFLKIDMNPEIEHCWTLTGRKHGSFWCARRVFMKSGETATVDFDAQWVLDREEQHGDVLGFYHTHPNGPAQPSQRDLRTMRAWVSSFGKPMLCLIESLEPSKESIPKRKSNLQHEANESNKVTTKLVAFLFEDDASTGQPMQHCEIFPDEVVIVGNT